MKKILIILVLLVVVFLIFSGLLFNNLDSIVKQQIESEGTKAIGSQVTVDGVTTDLKKGTMQISGLSIANAPGYSSPQAIKVGKFTMAVDYDNKIVEQITIEQPVINAEFKSLNENNFKRLLATIPKTEKASSKSTLSSGSTAKTTESAEKQQQEDDDDDALLLTIKQLMINNAKVNVNSDKLGKTNFVLKDIVLLNLEGSPQQIAKVITAQLSDTVSREASDYLKSQLSEKARDKLKGKLGDALKKLKLDK